MRLSPAGVSSCGKLAGGIFACGGDGRRLTSKSATALSFSSRAPSSIRIDLAIAAVGVFFVLRLWIVAQLRVMVLGPALAPHVGDDEAARAGTE